MKDTNIIFCKNFILLCNWLHQHLLFLIGQWVGFHIPWIFCKIYHFVENKFLIFLFKCDTFLVIIFSNSWVVSTTFTWVIPIYRSIHNLGRFQPIKSISQWFRQWNDDSGSFSFNVWMRHIILKILHWSLKRISWIQVVDRVLWSTIYWRVLTII